MVFCVTGFSTSQPQSSLGIRCCEGTPYLIAWSLDWRLIGCLLGLWLIAWLIGLRHHDFCFPINCLRFDILNYDIFFPSKRYTNRNDANDFERLRSDNVLPEFSRGIVRLEPDEFFSDGKIVLWMGAIDTGFAFVLENSENVHVALLNLKLLIQNLQQYTQIMTEPVVALARVERILMVVEKSVPNGVLPLHTSAMLKERLKEMDKSFSRLTKEK